MAPPKNPEDSELLTYEQAGRILGISRRTVIRRFNRDPYFPQPVRGADIYLSPKPPAVIELWRQILAAERRASNIAEKERETAPLTGEHTAGARSNLIYRIYSQ